MNILHLGLAEKTTETDELFPPLFYVCLWNHMCHKLEATKMKKIDARPPKSHMLLVKPAGDYL